MDRGNPGRGQRTAPDAGRRIGPRRERRLGEEQPNWVVLDHVMTFHDLAIENHGGRHGIRNRGLLEQAITRPQRLWYYESMDNMALLAACYTASIVFIHPFVDGNKRTGWGSSPGETGWNSCALPRTPTRRFWDSPQARKASGKKNSWPSSCTTTCGPTRKHASGLAVPMANRRAGGGR